MCFISFFPCPPSTQNQVTTTTTTTTKTASLRKAFPVVLLPELRRAVTPWAEMMIWTPCWEPTAPRRIRAGEICSTAPGTSPNSSGTKMVLLNNIHWQDHSISSLQRKYQIAYSFKPLFFCYSCPQEAPVGPSPGANDDDYGFLPSDDQQSDNGGITRPAIPEAWLAWKRQFDDSLETTERLNQWIIDAFIASNSRLPSHYGPEQPSIQT